MEQPSEKIIGKVKEYITPEWFVRVCKLNSLNIDQGSLAQLEEYVALLLHANEKVNLISRKDEDHIWPNHILHSLSMLTKVTLQTPASIVDIGTGGGLPGVPLAIVLPGCSFTLIDSIKKKAEAVAAIVSQLHLTNVRVECGRAEELARTSHAHRYHYAIARAVTQLPDLVLWSNMLLDHKSVSNSSTGIHRGDLLQPRTGSLIAYKGGNIDEEVAKTKKMKHVSSVTIVPLTMAGYSLFDEAEKKIVVVQLSL